MKIFNSGQRRSAGLIFGAIGLLLTFLLHWGAPQSVQAQVAGEKLFGVHEFNIGAQASGLPDRTVLMKQVGAKIVRLPISWHLVEGAGKGQTPQWLLDILDADITAAERNGLKVIVEMAYSPCWASSAPNKRCSDPNYNDYITYPPTNPNDYGDALARLVQRYKNRVYAWEIWNEPNLVQNWKPLAARPAAQNDLYNSFVDLAGARRYAELVKATYPKVKAASPTATVLVGAIAGGDVDYLNAMYAAGVKGSFDALSMHPYAAPYPVASSDPRYGKEYGPDECFPSSDPKTAKFWCVKAGVENIRQAMLAKGDDKPIWLTEFGFSSTAVWNGSGPQGQADNLRKAVQLIKGWNFVPVACWYQLIDRYAADDREGRFGLFTTALGAKPAATAFREAIGQSGSGLSKPVLLSPKGTIATTRPIYRWQPVAGATQYFIWVNQYGSNPQVPGKVQMTVTPSQASCTATECRFQPTTTLVKGGAEWWVTAIGANGARAESPGQYFIMQ
ncbi:MAG: glycoside hydrolase family 5 protein [Alkalinema sp. RU_4_3]|nr:glycoside hydrolase family 5 protein [Alkalinema sp. RU_4_3]